MARSVEGRIAWLRSAVPPHAGMCAEYVWRSLDVSRLGVNDAAAAAAKVAAAGHMHRSGPSSAPRGAVMFWRGGSSGHGHMALSLGVVNGVHRLLSTDVHGLPVGDVPTSYIVNHWTALRWAGWSSWYSVELPMDSSMPSDYGDPLTMLNPDGQILRLRHGELEWFTVTGWNPVGGGSGFATDHDVPIVWFQDGFNTVSFQDTVEGRAAPWIQTHVYDSDVLACRIAPPKNRYRAPTLWWFVMRNRRSYGVLTVFDLDIYRALWSSGQTDPVAGNATGVGFEQDWRRSARKVGRISSLAMTDTGTVFVDRRRDNTLEVILYGIWPAASSATGATYALSQGRFCLTGLVPTLPTLALGHISGEILMAESATRPSDWVAPMTVDGGALDQAPPTSAFSVLAFDSPVEGALAMSVLSTYGQTQVTPPEGWTATHVVAGGTDHLSVWVATCDSWATGMGTTWQCAPNGSGQITDVVTRGYAFTGGSGLHWAPPSWNQSASGPYGVQWEPPASVNGVWMQFIAGVDVDYYDVNHFPSSIDLDNLPVGYMWNLVGVNVENVLHVSQWLINYPGAQITLSPDQIYTSTAPFAGESTGKATSYGGNPETVGLCVWAAPEETASLNAGVADARLVNDVPLLTAGQYLTSTGSRIGVGAADGRAKYYRGGELWD